MFGHWKKVRDYLEAEGFSLVKDERESSWLLVSNGETHLTAFRQGDLLAKAEKEFGICL